MEKTEMDFSCPDERLQKYWDIYIVDIKERDNVKPSHLRTLESLCRLLKQEDKLFEFIEENGYSYPSENPRSGELYKEFQEVKIYKQVLAEIRQYSSLLGLKLEKDKIVTKKDSAESDWS